MKSESNLLASAVHGRRRNAPKIVVQTFVNSFHDLSFRDTDVIAFIHAASTSRTALLSISLSLRVPVQSMQTFQDRCVL